MSSSSLQALRDDLQSIRRDIGEHHTSSMESFASLNTNLGRTSSTVDSIILARLDEISRQYVALRDSWDQSSEMNRITATRLVSSNVSTSPDFMYSHTFPGKRCQEYSIRSPTKAEPLQVCL